MTPLRSQNAHLNTTGWHARLDLLLEKGQTRTVLRHAKHTGPLTVQQPLYPEDDVCHLYLLHPPGGLVGGDCLEVKLQLKKEASALITTPGATKFYRSTGQPAVQDQHLSVAEGAALEWFPQETIVFPGAAGRISTRIELAQTSVFMGWDIICLGLPAIKKRFESGSLVSSLTIQQNGCPIFRDRLSIEGLCDLDTAAGLRKNPVTASFWASGVTQHQFEQIRKDITIDYPLFGMTLLDDLLVARYLGNSPQESKNMFLQVHEKLRPMLTGKKAHMPRIWNT